MATPRISPKVMPRVFLREHREDEGLNQEQLAARLHTTAATISRWEKGKVRLDLGVLGAIAEALNRPLQALFTPPAPRPRPSKPSTDEIAAITAEVIRQLSKRR